MGEAIDGLSLAAALRPLPHGASVGELRDGRLFLQHGPINLVVDAQGDTAAVEAARARLTTVFPDWLGELVQELEPLRMSVERLRSPPSGTITRPMYESAAALQRAASSSQVDVQPLFVTSMAAVAGAVADRAVTELSKVSGIRKAYVNNGGDIAFLLSEGERYRIGIVPDQDRASLDGQVLLKHEIPVRGVATSGWRGRSHSLGVADSVTVLARSAVLADGAATLVANAVDVPSERVGRVPAIELDEASDLGRRLVTTAVGPLTRSEKRQALGQGEALARRFLQAGLVEGVLLWLQGEWRSVGTLACAEIDGTSRALHRVLRHQAGDALEART